MKGRPFFPECPMPQETSSKRHTLSRCSVSALSPSARSALPQRFPFGSSRAGQGLNLQQITGTKVPKEAQVIRSFEFIHRWNPVNPKGGVEC